MLTPKEAREQGFTIDTTCYPWVAYKGPRFKPEALERCHTDTETNLLEALTGLVAAEDRFERESGCKMTDPVADAVKVARRAILVAPEVHR